MTLRTATLEKLPCYVDVPHISSIVHSFQLNCGHIIKSSFTRVESVKALHVLNSQLLSEDVGIEFEPGTGHG